MMVDIGNNKVAMVKVDDVVLLPDGRVEHVTAMAVRGIKV